MRKREALCVRRTLVAPAEDVWELISAGDRVERWFGWVEETVVESPAEGGLRTIRMKDGTSFPEFITLNDADTRTYQYYAPDPPLPIKHVIGTHRLVTGPGGATIFSWLVSFERTSGAPRDLTSVLLGLYTGALEKIDAIAGTR